MAVLFFDTSALVRRYDLAEVGAREVRALCRASAGHSLVISQLTPVEAASALARKFREGRLDQSQLQRRWRAFLTHRAAQYLVMPLDGSLCDEAQKLLFATALRAADALQVATCMRAHAAAVRRREEFHFYTADARQARAAQAAGIPAQLIQGSTPSEAG